MKNKLYLNFMKTSRPLFLMEFL